MLIIAIAYTRLSALTPVQECPVQGIYKVGSNQFTQSATCSHPGHTLEHVEDFEEHAAITHDMHVPVTMHSGGCHS